MITKNKKFWGWAGKAALIAIPAAISSYASYAKSKVEAEAKTKFTYETLQNAIRELQDRQTILERECVGDTLFDLNSLDGGAVWGTAIPLADPPYAPSSFAAIVNGQRSPLAVPMANLNPPTELPAKFEDAIKAQPQ